MSTGTEQLIQVWMDDGTRSYGIWNDNETAQEAMDKSRATGATLIPVRRQVGPWEVAGDVRRGSARGAGGTAQSAT